MSFIEIKNAKYSYNEGTASEVHAVNGISLNVEEGEFVALVGHNGSGKSTIAKLLNGLLEPSEGKVEVFGMATDDEATADVKENAEVDYAFGKVYESQNERFLIPSASPSTTYAYNVTFDVVLLVSGQEIDTYETSILPYEDCCTVFTPKHPKTKPTLGQVIHAERNLDREALIQEALASVEKVTVKYDDEPLL